MSEEQTGEIGGTGPRQPSQAEGDRETIAADLRERHGEEGTEQTAPAQPREHDTPAARDPQQQPSQAEGERDQG